MTTISAAIFDWDKTLVDTMEGIRIACNYTFKKMQELGYEVDVARTGKGYGEWTPEETQLRFFRASHEFFDMNFSQFGPGVAAKAFHIEVLAGAMETLKLLAAKGIPTAIVSNKDQDLLQNETDETLRTFLGPELADKIVIKGASAGERGKPYPDPIFDALKQLNVNTNKAVWMVGDSISDVKAGIKSGSHGILFSDINRPAMRALQAETDPAKQTVVVGQDVGFVDSHKDLQKLINSATIVPTQPYDAKDNPHFVCKEPVVAKPTVKKVAQAALRM